MIYNCVNFINQRKGCQESVIQQLKKKASHPGSSPSQNSSSDRNSFLVIIPSMVSAGLPTGFIKMSHKVIPFPYRTLSDLPNNTVSRTAVSQKRLTTSNQLQKLFLSHLYRGTIVIFQKIKVLESEGPVSRSCFSTYQLCDLSLGSEIETVICGLHTDDRSPQTPG